jgi:transcriptional repressor NrdR
MACDRRYTTYERAESAPLRVVKKGGDRVGFERRKILNGLVRACEKRPVSSEQLDAIVERVERRCLEAFDKEVPSKIIGKLIMDELKQLDQVAFVRFASVYRDFQDVTEFYKELKTMVRQSQHRMPLEGGNNEEAGEFSST